MRRCSWERSHKPCFYFLLGPFLSSVSTRAGEAFLRRSGAALRRQYCVGARTGKYASSDDEPYRAKPLRGEAVSDRTQSRGGRI